jgi:hypothetical protein
MSLASLLIISLFAAKLFMCKERERERERESESVCVCVGRGADDIGNS